MLKASVKNENTVKAMESFAHLVLNDDFMLNHKAELSIAAALFLKEMKWYNGKEDAYVALICSEEDGKFIINSICSIAKTEFNYVDLEDFSCKLLAAIRTAEAAKEFGII